MVLSMLRRYWSPSTDGGTVDQVYRLRFVADEILHRRQESILPRAEMDGKSVKIPDGYRGLSLRCT
jgi:hypothetical protein